MIARTHGGSEIRGGACRSGLYPRMFVAKAAAAQENGRKARVGLRLEELGDFAPAIEHEQVEAAAALLRR